MMGEEYQQFLKTIESMANFAETLKKIKSGAEGPGVRLNQSDCKSIIWALQLLRVSNDG